MGDAKQAMAIDAHGKVLIRLNRAMTLKVNGKNIMAKQGYQLWLPAAQAKALVDAGDATYAG